MKKIIKEKLGKQWTAVVVDGNSSSVNSTVRRQLNKFKELSQRKTSSKKSKPLIIAFFFKKGRK
jgi:hypothetical protein